MPAAGPRLTTYQVDTLRKWIDTGAEWPEATPSEAAAIKRPDHWAFKRPVRPPVPAVKQRAWVRNPDRCLCAGQARSARLEARARSRAARSAAAAVPRFDRPAADAGRAGRLAQKSHGGIVRSPGRRFALPPNLRRALGPALAGCRALCRNQRLRARRYQAERLEISRLRDSRVQPRQAVRPLHARATGRRRAARKSTPRL